MTITAKQRLETAIDEFVRDECDGCTMPATRADAYERADESVELGRAIYALVAKFGSRTHQYAQCQLVLDALCEDSIDEHIAACAIAVAIEEAK